jgi:hypothetical protein
MTDTFLAALFVALCVDIFVWIVLCRAIFRRLYLNHPETAIRLFGSPLKRKNGMDRFFSLAAFLFSGKPAPPPDLRLSLYCVLLKVCSVLLFLIFVSMMFGPMFLRLH